MLQISEIYYSIQGESSYRGQPCIFIRLTGCDLRCKWCDTEYAFHGGTKYEIPEILNGIKKYPCKLVEVTGGEPLLQRETPELIQQLLTYNYKVLIETGGHRSIKNLPHDAITIMDIKCPGSKEADKIHWQNLDFLRPQDEIKFVITNKEDYEWAKNIVKTKLHYLKNIIHFSPVYKILDQKDLAKWILNDNLPVTLTTQLHKELNLP